MSLIFYFVWSWIVILLFNFFDGSKWLDSLCLHRLRFSYYKPRLLASISILRYHGVKDLQTNSRSPYAYWHLHLHPILLRFPRRTRACNSFPLSDRVLGLSYTVSALIYRSVSQDGIRKRETSAARRYKSCQEQCASLLLLSLQW